METSNNLKHTISVNNETLNTIVKIRLNDECKNGHQDFSITATFWEIDKPRNDRNMIFGGCCHDEILSHFPELQIFVNLHLCDYKGIPMHAIENGFYHLVEGFNNTKPNNENFKSEFCSYYRMTENQFNILSTAKEKNYFGFLLVKLGILDQWKKEADQAIELLEQMTGKKFIVDSVRTQFNLTNEQLKQIENDEKTGLYSIDKIEAREQEKKDNKKAELLKNLTETFEQKSLELKKDFELDKIGIELFLTTSNVIYYKHKNEVVFNWQKDSYSKQYSETEFKMFLDIAKENEILKDCNFILN
ncbi:MAG: hypothetical protein QG594_2138 [Bacteroidota bacterium]|nr:hypothetical protein [Bacteroidota bacterium]